MDSNILNILLVDDDPNLLKTLSDILKVKGFAPVAVETGAAALAQIEQQNIAVALIDLKLEDMSGLEVLRGIQAHSPDTECILLTGYASQSSAIEAINASVYAYFQKPFDIDQLVLSIRRAGEKRLAEQARRESEERFRVIFENANDAFHIDNADDKILEVNSRMCALMGYSRAELLQMHVADLQAPEMRQPGNVIKNELARHGSAIFEGLNLHRDGRRIPVEISFGQIDLPSGKLYVSILRDISERKQAEENLAHQAEELRLRNEELDRLYRASESLISSTPFNLQTLAQTIVGVILREFGQANCSVFLVQKDSNELSRLAAGGSYADQVNKVKLTAEGAGLVPLAIRTGQVINSPDVRGTPVYIPDWEAARAELTIPLQIGAQIIGAIDIQSSEPNAFNSSDERFMAIFAGRAALVLEHARLFVETQGRLQNLISLRTVDQAISSSFDLRSTLGILLDQVIEQLQVDAADVLVFNPVTQTFQYSIGQGFHTQPVQHPDIQLDDDYAGRAARERRTIVVQNLEKDPGRSARSEDFTREGFTSYIGIPLIAKGQVKAVLEIFHLALLELDQERNDFLEMLAGQAAIAIDNAELFEKLQSSNVVLMMAYDETIEGWSRAMDLRDEETEGHAQRVTQITLKLAGAMGLGIDDMDYIRWGALLHDIGKMGVPDSILHKPGPLSEEEWVLMRKHPQLAYDMLAPIVYLHPAIDIPYCHHEKWDGTGYPRRLEGEQIPLAARIFAVVDVYDALISDRPYRKAWSRAKAMEYIHEQSGRYFDPQVVEKFSTMHLNVGANTPHAFQPPGEEQAN
jgi:PAS domain S-box-containing protein/putative nucleotidyltransferase with HDIG domain